MPIETRPFDVRNYLNTPDEQREYLSQVVGDGDLREIADAVMVVAEVQGRNDVAYNARSVRDGSPDLDGVRQLLSALGWRLQIGDAQPQAA